MRALQDLRFAVRQLGRDRMFTITAVLTLALGIGATTAMFGVLSAALLRPPPFDHPERLASIYTTRTSHSGVQLGRWSWPRLSLLAQRITGFERVGSFTRATLPLTDADPEPAQVEIVSSGYFTPIHVRANLRRTFH